MKINKDEITTKEEIKMRKKLKYPKKTPKKQIDGRKERKERSVIQMKMRNRKYSSKKKVMIERGQKDNLHPH